MHTERSVPALSGGTTNAQKSGSVLAVAPPPNTIDPSSLRVAPKTWKPRKLSRDGFPDRGDGKIPLTIANLRHLLDANGIVARYNVIRKRFEVSIPDLPGVIDNGDSVAIAHVRSLLALHGIPSGEVAGAIEAIANQNPYNPVADWIASKPWDGVDRLPQFYDTITTRPDYPVELKKVLLRRWLLSAAAAGLMPHGFSTRGMLVLQGPQSIGKTRWGMRLISDPGLRSEVLRLDHHFDGSKDSITGAVRYWIVELGELESSLKRDKERLKGFITRDRDSLRLPYAASESEFPRRTVFFATANGYDFLTDPTGATRFYVIEVASIDYEHDVDMQQLWAQVAAELAIGRRWWLTKEEERQLEEWNDAHRAVSVVSELLANRLDLDDQGGGEVKRMTARETLIEAGMENRSTMDAREAGALLRKHFGDPTKIQGSMKFKITLRAPAPQPDHPKPKSKFD